MSVSLYAGKESLFDGTLCMGPVIDFKHWDAEILAEDCDAREERGEDPFIPNPDFIPNAVLNVSNYNADVLLLLMELSMGEDGPYSFPIQDAITAATAALNGNAVAYTEPYSVTQNTRTTTVVDFATKETVSQEIACGPTVHSFGIPEGYVRDRLTRLLALLVDGRKQGATHLCVA